MPVYGDDEYYGQFLTPEEIAAAADEQEELDWDRAEYGAKHAESMMFSLAHFLDNLPDRGPEHGNLCYDPQTQQIVHGKHRLFDLSITHIDLRGM